MAGILPVFSDHLKRKTLIKTWISTGTFPALSLKSVQAGKYLKKKCRVIKFSNFAVNLFFSRKNCLF